MESPRTVSTKSVVALAQKAGHVDQLLDVLLGQ